MFICPTCGKEFDNDYIVTQHFLQCWKKQHPNHKSKQAPHSEDIETRTINSDVENFFSQFNKGANHET